jgi:hypothetical protein
MVDLLSGVAATAFVVEARPIAPPASDILLAGLPIPLVFFSSPEAPDLVLSSFEARDGRDLCVLAAGPVPEAGFFALERVAGRAGGLFRVLPVLERAVVVLVGFMNEEVFEGVGWVPANGRFGGTVAFLAG